MNQLKTNIAGGFPIKLDDFRWIAEGINTAFKGIMSTYGIADNVIVILSGCKKTTAGSITTIGDGYVSRGGEIMYVPEHSFTSPTPFQRIYWQLESTFDAAGLKTFQDSSTHDTYEIRVVKCEVIAINPLLQEYKDADTIYEIINRNVDGFPVGGICMWSGDPTDLPAGWSLCDGTSGTPDLRGRFVIGYDARTTDPANGIWDANYNTVGNAGGEKKHQLTNSELPTHQHNLAIDNVDGGDYETIIVPGAFLGTSNLDPGVQSVTGGKMGPFNVAHENRPPYYVLAYIMKTVSQVNSSLPGYI